MKTLSIDIETYGSIDLTKSGVYKYTQNDFEILLIAYAYDDEEITFPADTWKRRSFPLFWLVRHPPVSTRTVKGAFKHLPALDGLGACWYHTTSQNKSMNNQQIL